MEAPGRRAPAKRPARSTVALVVVAAATAAVLLRGPRSSPEPNQLLLLVALVALGVVIASERRCRSLRRATVFRLSLGLLGLAVVVPPIDSNDVWAYAMYGRIIAHHGDSPYTSAAADYPGDPFSRRVDPVWQRARSVYGPIFTAMSAIGMRLAGDSPLRARLFFQGLAALAVLLALLILDRRVRDPVVVAVVGVNPLTALSIVNGAHNDALVGVAVLVAVFLALDDRPAAAGAALAFGAMIKIIALLPMVAIALWVWRRRGFRDAAAVGGVALCLVAGSIAVWGGREMLAPLEAAARRFTGDTIWSGAVRLLADERVRDGVSRAVAEREAAREVSRWAQFMVLALALPLVARRLDRPSPAPAVTAAVLAYMLGAMYVYAWYVAWALPVLALVWDSRLAWLVLGHAGILQIVALPDPRLYVHDPLRILTPLQRLQLDAYWVWMPLLTLGLLVVVVVITAAPSLIGRSLLSELRPAPPPPSARGWSVPPIGPRRRARFEGPGSMATVPPSSLPPGGRDPFER